MSEVTGVRESDQWRLILCVCVCVCVRVRASVCSRESAVSAARRLSPLSALHSLSVL